jgi:hypothetical protein
MCDTNMTQQRSLLMFLLARNVSGVYTHHQELQTLSSSVWSPAPSSVDWRWSGRAAVQFVHVEWLVLPIFRSIRPWEAAYGFLHPVLLTCVGPEGPLRKSYVLCGWCSSSGPSGPMPVNKIGSRKPYAATQGLMLLMMGIYARNMSS